MKTTTSLYDATTASFIRTSGAMKSVMDKSRKYFGDEGTDPDSILPMSLYPDMRPFIFQVISIFIHSMDTLRALESGVFEPKIPQLDPTFNGLALALERNCDNLGEFTPERVNALDLGGELRLERGDMIGKHEFVFARAIPNFYFHATTAYDILRMNGAPIGKRDFLGIEPE